MTIHFYALQGDIEGVAAALASGVEVDCRAKESRKTPLMCAAGSAVPRPEMVRFLIDNGADVNAVGQVKPGFKPTPLNEALWAGHLEIVRLLLEAGADAAHRRPDGKGVLSIAQHCFKGEKFAEVVRLLCAHGATWGAQDSWEGLSSTGDLQRIRILLEIGGDEEALVAENKWHGLLCAVALGSVEDVQRSLAAGGDMTARDEWHRTPWLLSVQAGELEKAKLLLAAGADREERGDRHEKTALIYAAENGHVAVVEWLLAQGCDIEEQDKFGDTALMNAVEANQVECVRFLLNAGANAHAVGTINQRAIKMVTNHEILQLLLDAGADLADINDEMRAALTGVECEGELFTTAEAYWAGRHARRGTANPERIYEEFWHAMVRSGADSYQPRKTLDDMDFSEPVWCFQRFGKSFAALSDGRFIEIGGKHEDLYDPDFYIYNDVVVHYGGGRFEIYGYPLEVFPPTDFHSATLVGNAIYIIGCLGYVDDRRPGTTPIYRLDCSTLAIEKVETIGDNPGWIFRHRAVFQAERHCIEISGGKIHTQNGEEHILGDNPHRYVLDLTQRRWHRVQENAPAAG